MISFTFKKTAPKDKNCGSIIFEFHDDSAVHVRGEKKELRVGVGPRGKMNGRKLLLAARKAVTLAKTNKISAFSLEWDAWESLPAEKTAYDRARLLAENAEMANFEFVQYKTPPTEGWAFVKNIAIVGKVPPEAKKGARDGQVVGDAVNACRTLANTPGGEMTPRVLAEAAKKAVEGTGTKVSVLGEETMKKLRMGGVLGVAKGSEEPPQFIILEYAGGEREEKPVVLIGKGVTFDTGGLNLKPGDSMNDMHMDMSGGAAVIHAVALAAKRGIKKNVIGLIPAVENAPSGKSYRPGDILRSMSGKTIEVLNTDAEGRIILADALHFSRRYKPEFVVDVATLTGAAMVALGQRCSALFSNDKNLSRRIEECGEESGDYVWPLPLWEEYAEEIKGTFGDIANVGKTRYGGAITGAMFLAQFAEGLRWAHLDIAPRMTATEDEHLAKGAAGAPVRLLARLLGKEILHHSAG